MSADNGCKTVKKGPLTAGLFSLPDFIRRFANVYLTSIVFLLLLTTSALYLLSPLFHPRLGAIGHNDQRAISTISIALGAALVAFRYFFRPASGFFPAWVEHMVWLVVVLGLTAAAMSAYPLRAALEVFLYLCLFYVAGWLYQYYCTLGAEFVFMALSRLAVVFVSIYAIAFLSSYATWLLLPEFYCSSCVMPHFDNMRAFNDVQTWLMPFLWYFALQSQARGMRKILAFMPAIFFGALFFYTYARGATLGVLLAIAFIAFRHRVDASRFISIAAGSMMLGWLLNTVLTRVVPALVGRPLPSDMLSRVVSRGTSGRTDLWQAAGEMLLANPLFGVGPQHYSYQLYHHYEHLGPFGSPHNMFLMFLTEWGIVGGLLLSLGILWFLYAVIRRPAAYEKTNEGTQEKQVAEATVISVFVSSLFAGSLLSPLSQMMLVLLAPALLLVNQNKTALVEQYRTPFYGYGILLLGAGLYLAGMTIYDIIEHGDIIFITTETAYPRYWQNGFFWRY